jgi:hypothetical protein
VLSDPSFIGSSKRPLIKREATPKKRKRAHQKRPPIKKETTQKKAKWLIKIDLQ